MTKEIKNKFFEKNIKNLITKNIPIVSGSDDIDFIKNYIIKNTDKLDSINYIYIINNKNILKGIISIKEIFRQSKNKKASQIMTKKLIVARPHTDQEKIAYLSLKNNIKSVPIIDKNNKFLGVVLGDDILNILYKELREDISRLAGISNHKPNKIDDIFSMPLLISLKHRLPWLIIGLFGGLIAAQVINLFEETLSKNIILAAFIPLVVYMSSAVGTQIGFFIIRDLAIHSKINFWMYTLRQFKIILGISVIISSIVFFITFLIYSQIMVAWALTLAIFLATLSSIITGLFIPYAFNKLRFDPANASGPIATITQDIISVTIYLLIAKSIL